MDQAELKQAVLEAQAQIQMQAQQALAERMTETCFKRCVSAPMEKLADKQRRCLDQCTSAFIEGFGVAVSGREEGVLALRGTNAAFVGLCLSRKAVGLPSDLCRHPFSHPSPPSPE